MAPISSGQKVHFRSDRSVTQLMLENVSNSPPEKVISEDALTNKKLTYQGLRDDAFKAASTLRQRYGIQRGDIVTIIGRSCADYLLAVHAIWAAGGTVSTINHSNSTEEFSHAINIVKPSLFIVDAATQQKLKEAIQKSGASYTNDRILTLVKRLPEHSLFPEDTLVNATRVTPEAYVLDGQDAHRSCAAIVFSSGTTGKPKAVMLSHYNLCAIAVGLRGHNPDNWRGSDREIFFPPLSHIYGLYVCALLGPWIGSYIYLMHAFDLRQYCKLMQDKRATLARTLPTVAQALATSEVVNEYSYPTLEYFSCAGAVLKPTTAASLRQKFPHVSLCQTYGCTETSSCLSQSGKRDADAPLVATGTLLPNIRMVFVDDNLKEVPPGTPGEICVETPTLMMFAASQENRPIDAEMANQHHRGYKDNMGATNESMLSPGWYRTGDVGFLDSDGYLIIVDRIKDIIKYKGFQVSPTELEEIIGTHKDVQDVGVSSVYYEPEATDVPRAYVKTAPSMQATDHKRLANEIKNLVATKLAGYKKLRGGVKFVTSLPRNPTGKMLRRLLKDLEKPVDKAKL